MPLSNGTRLGPYEITGTLGAGGMGEVYRATDTNLKREVAIKVLPESVASDADRLARFQREAEVLASLNHPHIAQIYGLEKTEGATALILELVEGPTLADRIAESPIPPDEALVIAMQIADALEAAHDLQIVHRDLKPANIKLRPDGTVKVLDFGIAKALETRSGAQGMHTPSLTTPAMTEAGFLLGTAAYMSPEQARGKPVDQRADIWAFGCVLYEMLTGQPAFAGEDVHTTLARVLANDIDMAAIPSTISPPVRQTLKLCLQKDAKKRVRDIGDVKLALEGMFEGEAQHAAGDGAAQPDRSRLPLVAAAVIVAAVIAGLAGWTLRPSPPAPAVQRFTYELPAGQAFRFPPTPVMAFAQNGREFVYNTADGLYLRSMDQLGARLVQGTEQQQFTTPVLSPDGQSVAYFQIPNELRRIPVTGGASLVVAHVGPPFGASWQKDGTILYGQAQGIFRVSANGGKPELVVPAKDGERVYGPELLPNSDWLLFSVTTGSWAQAAQVVAQSLSTGERRTLINGGADAYYVPTGHLVYAFNDVLYAVPFNAESLTVSGTAVPVVQGVMRASGDSTGTANYSVADDGTLVYVSGSTTAGGYDYVWVDADGRESATGMSCACFNPALSPDGRRIAVTRGANGATDSPDIWIESLDQQTFTRLTFEPGTENNALWSPDGTQIVYESAGQLYMRRADGTGMPELVASGGGAPLAWTPDGELIIGAPSPDGKNRDIAVVAMTGEHERRTLISTEFNEGRAVLSPDGHWLAYQSDESGTPEIYVRPYPDVDSGKWQISSHGGQEPKWARDGRTLYFDTADVDLMAASVGSSQTAFDFKTPTRVLDIRKYFLPGVTRRYDVAPDGRFLFAKSAMAQQNGAAPRIVIVTHWTEELKRLVPTD